MKRYGIRMTLPPEDPMRAVHLLGDDWEDTQWFKSTDERDREYEKLLREDVYYRRGDRQSLVLEKTER